ncbi:MAG: hypothetical protein JXA44_05030 [Methanospirillaceae archaeon]|nr:hypothetical protein [Methanospirillaceae archaeon]
MTIRTMVVIPVVLLVLAAGASSQDVFSERNVFDAPGLTEVQTARFPDITGSLQQPLPEQTLLPDLFISSLNITSDAEPGELIPVGFIGENAGIIATGRYTIGFYLSTDSPTESSDLLLGTYSYDSLEPESSLYYFRFIRIPDDTAPGTYYFGIRADPFDEIDETNDTNNVASVPITLDHILPSTVTPAPTPSPVPASPPETPAGKETIAVTQTDTNGASPITPPPSAVTPVPEESTAPALTRTSQADLSISSVDIPEMSKPGELVQVGFVIQNSGSIASGSYKISFYLSQDMIVDLSDISLASSTYDSMGSGSSLYRLRFVPIPKDNPPGRYYLVVMADPQNTIDEGDETNNAGNAQITLKEMVPAPVSPAPAPGPTLTPVPTLPEETPLPEEITVLPPIQALPDLAVPLLDISDSVTAGELVQVGFSVTNPGSVSSGRYDTAFYLSSDTSIDLSDSILGSNPYDSLGSGSSMYYLRFIRIPESTPPGRYYLVVMADPKNALEEGDETNNACFHEVTVAGTMQPQPTPTTTVPVQKTEPVVQDLQTPEGAPDLSVVLVDAPESAEPGNEMPVFISVRNAGTAISGPFKIAFTLSKDRAFDTSDVILKTVSYDPLAAGDTWSETRTLLIPSFQSEGEYYIGIVIDSQDRFDELRDDNNAGFSNEPVEIRTITEETLTPLPRSVPPPAPTTAGTVVLLPGIELHPADIVPDIAVISVNAPKTASPGTDLQVSYTITNAGEGNSGPFKLGFTLSMDRIADGSDVVVKTVSYDPLAAGDTLKDSKTLFIPSFQSEGEYYLGVIADTKNQNDENNEDNNAGYTADPVTLRKEAGKEMVQPTPGQSTGVISEKVAEIQPDLVVVSVDVPKTISSGTEMPVTFTLANRGEKNSGPFRIDITLSEDAVPDDSDSVLHTFTNQPLKTKETFTDSRNVYILDTISAGDYYVFVLADTYREYTESEEDNNAGYAAFSVQISIPHEEEILPTPVPQEEHGVISERIGVIQPDLMVLSVTAPKTAAPGTDIEVSFSAKNTGTQGTGSFKVGFYLSQDTIITDSDFPLGSYGYDALAAEAALTDSKTLLIPSITPEEKYYLGVIADSYKQVGESSEDNNTGYASDTLTVTKSNVVETRKQPDLTILSVTAPGTAAPGSDIVVSFSAKNTGTQGTGSFKVGFYLSQDTIITDSDFPLGSYGYDALAAQATLSDSKTLLIPSVTPEGDYYSGVIVDSYKQIGESSEDNNTGYATTRLCIHPVIEVVVEQTPAPTPEVQLIEEPEGEPEADEQEAHLVIHSLFIPPNAKPGDTVTISFILENDGDADTLPFTVQACLSNDTTITDTDRLIGNEKRVDPIKAGEWQRMSIDLTLPPDIGPGEYYGGIIASVHDYARGDTGTIGDPGLSKDTISISKPATAVVILKTRDYPSLQVRLFVDNVLEAEYLLSPQVNPEITVSPGLHTFRMEWTDRSCEEKSLSVEQKETFEAGIQKKVYLTAVKSPLPDLQVAHVTVPYTVVAGEELQAEFDLYNNGESFVEEGFPVKLFLSEAPDLITSSADPIFTLFHSRISTKNIHEKVSIPIPADTVPGTWYLIVEVDNGSEKGLICEGREDNNRVVSDLITISAPEEPETEPEAEEEIEEPFDTSRFNLDNPVSSGILYSGLSLENEKRYNDAYYGNVESYAYFYATSWEDVARYKFNAAREHLTYRGYADTYQSLLKKGDLVVEGVGLVMTVKDLSNLYSNYDDIVSISSFADFADNQEVMDAVGKNLANYAGSMATILGSQPETKSESELMKGISMGMNAYMTGGSSLALDLPMYGYEKASESMKTGLSKSDACYQSMGTTEYNQAYLAEQLHIIGTMENPTRSDIEKYYLLARSFSELERALLRQRSAYLGDDEEVLLSNVNRNLKNIAMWEREFLW